MSHTKQTKNKQNKKASTEHAKSAYVAHNKPKKQTNRPQQNMLNQLMSHTTTKKTNKQASTEHAKSAYVTHIKLKKQAKRLQQ